MRHETRQQPILVDINGIADLLAISTRTAHRIVREPGFPAPVRPRRCLRWWRADVIDHVRGLTGQEEVEKLMPEHSGESDTPGPVEAPSGPPNPISENEM